MSRRWPHALKWALRSLFERLIRTDHGKSSSKRAKDAKLSEETPLKRVALPKPTTAKKTPAQRVDQRDVNGTVPSINRNMSQKESFSMPGSSSKSHFRDEGEEETIIKSTQDRTSTSFA